MYVTHPAPTEVDQENDRFLVSAKYSYVDCSDRNVLSEHRNRLTLSF